MKSTFEGEKGLKGPLTGVPVHHDITEIVLGIIICFIMGGLIHSLRVLDIYGTLSALAMGLLISIFGGLYWLIVLLVFIGVGYSATKFHIAEKKRMGLAEGGTRKGMRSILNVMSNGFVPMLIAVFSQWIPEAPLLYLVALSTAASDTLASEIGVLSKNVYLIGTFSRVEPGTDGGVSLPGTIASIIGAVSVGLIGTIAFVLSPPEVVLVIMGGFLGCQYDSVLGATLERRGYLGKASVNMVSAVLAVLTISLIAL